MNSESECGVFDSYMDLSSATSISDNYFPSTMNELQSNNTQEIDN